MRVAPTPFEPERRSHPVRTLALLAGVALLGGAFLIGHARTAVADESAWRWSPSWIVRADTDSVAVTRPEAPAEADLGALLENALRDSLGTDSLALADTVEVDADSVARARLYFPTPRRESFLAPLTDRAERAYQFELNSQYWRREAILDSTDFEYTITERVGGQDVRYPAVVGLDAYRAARLRASTQDGFRELAARRGRSQRRGGFGITIDIPGGRETPFASIFGKNEVDLRVNGQANIDLGFDYTSNELQQAVSGNSGQLNPDFGQELSLGITGTIGDKLRVNVNYDTQNQFDFENQVSLVYEGYDDDIIQRIEAGNVFLQTPSELIRGGQRLFGLRTDLRFGGLGLTAVASQQDAQSDELSIEGGSQTTEFSLAPYDYEDNTHFYLAYLFRNWWDEGHSDPNIIASPPGFDSIIGIDVWLHDNSTIYGGQPGSATNDEIISATALVDLGEPGPGNTVPGAPERGVLEGGDVYLAAYLDDVGATSLPNPNIDQYADSDLELLRDSLSQIDLEGTYGLRDSDYETTRFRRLIEGVDFTYDRILGFVSLKRSLTENEMIAVSYQYLDDDGNVVTIGDYGQGSTTGSTNGDRIILKLLRGNTPTPNDASWALTMRNIYRVGGRSLSPDAFEVDVLYEPSGQTAQPTLPGLAIGNSQRLLQTLGLDRLNRDGQLQPDDVFDFKGGITIDPGAGRIIFPNREPFGAYLRRVLAGQEDIAVNFQTIDRDAALRSYTFDTLYSLKPNVARQRFPNLDNYLVAGEYRSSVQSIYELGFAIVENSVVVTAGSIQLNEGTDYRVNYTSGTIEIINPTYLTSTQNIEIKFERQQFASIGSKTLLGLRADYTLGEDLALGATWMRLSEKPLIDKYRIGEEPLQNTIFGFDGRYLAEPRWLTRSLDALPLIQTRAPSRIELKGEFAQLLPDHPQTFAFEQERDALRAIDRDFKEDELQGLSFIDDFEGVENSYPLISPGDWRIAAAPSGSGPDGTIPWTAGLSVTDPRLASNWRGRFAWYSVLQGTYTNGDLCQEVDCTNPATRQIETTEIFRDRDVGSTQSRTLTTFDLFFDPRYRGPYNYNEALQTTYSSSPRDAWGGIVQRLPEGYTDFGGQNNIEFVEFIFSPIGGRNGTEAVGSDAVLYVDLGSVSEDVIPNRQFNQEDGLIESGSLDAWGRLPDGQANATVDFSETTGRTEDLGLDGLPSLNENPVGPPYALSERQQFAPFVEALSNGSTERFLAEEDASGDDYHHFEEVAYFNDANRFEGGRATLQERFSRFFPGHELNTFESQRDIAQSGEAGNSRFPDTEDLNDNFSPDIAESHYRYAIPLDDTEIRQSPYFQNDIVTPSGQTWYLMRIPVRSQEREAIGGIEDFSLIEAMRLWTTGHDKPATLRFATLELVGSQWLKSDRVGIEETDPTLSGTPSGGLSRPQLFIESVNTEENSSQYAIPRGALVSRTPDISGELRRNREQSLIFRIEDLGEGVSRAIYKPFSTNRLDLTKYSNVRMFVHGEGFQARDSVRIFVRLGTNETEDYYEYEQTIYPYEVPDLPQGESPNPDSLWQTGVFIGGETIDRNSVNIVLSALNQLKVERDDDITIPLDQRYSNGRTPDGAPVGTRLYIKGNPSIQTVSTVVLGVRNGEGGTTAPLEDVEVWFNELRVSGYDEASGWSAYTRATVQLADVGNINARFSRQTDGFGELSSGLGDRDFNDQQAYSVLASFNAHKLLPERFGWNVPVSLSVQQNQSTPRFAPQRGDIRVEELIAQVEEDPDIPAEEKNSRIEAIRAESETASFSRSLRIPISKSGSRSPFLRYTLDGVSVVYTTAQSSQRSPSVLFNDLDRWSGSFTYRLTVPRAKTIRPFWFIDDVPVLGLLGGLRLNYLPQSLTFTADADRSLREDQERPRAAVLNDSTLAGIPQNFLYPVRRDHVFGHGRAFDFTYNPLTFLALSYRSDISQSLSSTGIDERFRLFVRDSTGLTQEYDISREEAFMDGGPGRIDFGIPDSVNVNGVDGLQIYETRSLDVLPLGDVLGDVFAGERRPLTERFDQNLSGTLQPTLERIRWLSWLRPQPLSYTSQFSWLYTPVQGLDLDDDTVSGISAQASIRSGLQLRPRELWRLFPFYRKLEADEQASRASGRTGNRTTPRPPAGQRPRPPGDDPVAEGEEPEEGPPATSDPEAESADARPSLAVLGTLGRKLFLGLTGVEDITVTYNGTRTASAGGLLNEGYSLYDALTGDGPSLGYRLALDRRFGLDGRANALDFQDNLGDNHRLNARTSLRLTPELNVNLTWDTNWNKSEVFTYADDGTGLFDERSAVERGGGTATILAIGGSYDRLLDLQRERFEADVLADDAQPGPDGFYRSDVLTKTGVTQDFRSAFVQSAGAFGPDALLALPLPNWDITFSGLSKWPLIRALTQQVTMRHSYAGTYDLSYNSNADFGNSTAPRSFQLPTNVGTLTTRTLVGEIPFREPGSSLVNQRFQPLIGFNVTWKGGLQTDINWSQSETYSLSAATASVNQGSTEEVSLRLTYSKTGLRLPIFRRRRLNNNVRLTLTLSQSDTQDFTRFLRTDLQDLLLGNPLQDSQLSGSTRVTAEPRLSYAISNQVNMDIFLRYEKVDGRDSRIPTTSSYNGGFSFRVSFSN